MKTLTLMTSQNEARRGLEGGHASVARKLDIIVLYYSCGCAKTASCRCERLPVVTKMHPSGDGAPGTHGHTVHGLGTPRSGILGQNKATRGTLQNNPEKPTQRQMLTRRRLLHLTLRLELPSLAEIQLRAHLQLRRQVCAQ